MYVYSNNRVSNLRAIGLLILYIIAIQYTEIRELGLAGIMSLALIVLVVFITINRAVNSKQLLDPSLWFPLAYCIANVMAVVFIYYTDIYLGWFDSLRFQFKTISVYFLTLNAIALIGFYLGNMLVVSRKKVLSSTVKIEFAPKVYRKLYKRGMILLLIAIIIQYVKVVQSGGLSSLGESYGVGQFEGRGGIMYLLTQFKDLIYLCSVALLFPLILVNSNKKQDFIAFFICAVIYLFPSVLGGHRSDIFFFGVVFLINYFYFKKPNKKINFSTIFKLSVAFLVLMIVFGSVRAGLQGMNEYFLIFFSNFTGTSSVSMASILVFDHYYYGFTYLSAFLNLVPIYFYGGARPFMSPALTFKELYAPGVQNQGFGFSMFGEAYMNGGGISVFLFFFVFSIFLTSFLLKPKKSIVGIALITIIIVQSLWYLRADSIAFVKILVYSFLVLKLVTFDVKSKSVKNVKTNVTPSKVD